MDKTIIFIILFIILGIYIYYDNNKTIQELNIERFTAEEPNVDENIKKAVSQIYLADVDAIRNLSEIAVKLQKDGLNLPGNGLVQGTLTVNGETAVKNKLTVDGGSVFKNVFSVDGLTTLNDSANIKKNLTVDGITTIVGDTTLNKNLVVGGSTTVNGTTNIVGATTLNDNANIKKNLFVDGLTTLNGTTVNGLATLNGDAGLKKNLTVDGLTTLNGATINGLATLNNDTAVKKNLIVDGLFAVGNVATFNSNSNIKKDLTVDGLSILNGATTINGLTANGDAGFNKNVTVNGLSTLNNAIVNGLATINGDTGFKKNVTVDGVTTLNGTVVNGNALLNGDATLKKNLNVDGIFSVGLATTLNGDANAKKNLTVDGVTTLNATNINGTATLAGATNINGAATLNGDASLKKTLTVDGATTLKGATNINGITTIKGTGGILNIEGSTTTGVGSHSYISFFPRTLAQGRKAYIGFPGDGSTNLTIHNQDEGNININTKNKENALTIDKDGATTLNGATTLKAIPDTAALMLEGSAATGPGSNSFIGFFPRTKAQGRKGYIGFGMNNTTDIDIQNEDEGSIFIGTKNKTKAITVDKDGATTVNNNLNVTGKVKENGNDLVPKGSIIAYHPPNFTVSTADIVVPGGWALCDGTNGTPDLRGRFIKGASSNLTNDGDLKGYNNAVVAGKKLNNTSGLNDGELGISRTEKYSWIFKMKHGDYGGTDHMVLSKSELPAHSHRYITSRDDGNSSHQAGQHPAGDAGKSSNPRDTFTENDGGEGWGHNNLPPYYVLTYIMKL